MDGERRLLDLAYEGMLARMERTIKRLWILALVLVCLLVATNGVWLWYESQWQEVTTTESYEAITDGGGTAIANGSGEVTYGPGEVYKND